MPHRSQMAGVGERLRWVRRSLGMSMADVSRLSGNRWSSSVIGYYERGRRGMAATTLGELAGFYGVTCAFLLGEENANGRQAGGDQAPLRILLHRPTLAITGEATPIDRFADWIATTRGEREAEWLSVRASDLRVMAAALHTAPSTTITQLRRWGCEIAGSAGVAPDEAPERSDVPDRPEVALNGRGSALRLRS